MGPDISSRGNVRPNTQGPRRQDSSPSFAAFDQADGSQLDSSSADEGKPNFGFNTVLVNQHLSARLPKRMAPWQAGQYLQL